MLKKTNSLLVCLLCSNYGAHDCKSLLGQRGSEKLLFHNCTFGHTFWNIYRMIKERQNTIIKEDKILQIRRIFKPDLKSFSLFNYCILSFIILYIFPKCMSKSTVVEKKPLRSHLTQDSGGTCNHVQRNYWCLVLHKQTSKLLVCLNTHREELSFR